MTHEFLECIAYAAEATVEQACETCQAIRDTIEGMFNGGWGT